MYYITEANGASLNMSWSLSMLQKHIILSRKTNPGQTEKKPISSGVFTNEEKKKHLYDKQRDEDNINPPLLI